MQWIVGYCIKVCSHQTRMKRCMLSQCKDAIDNRAALLRANEAARIERLGRLGAFTPDANEANKSRYSRIVGCLNILSLLASFAREIRVMGGGGGGGGGRGVLQAAPVSLLNVFLFL